MTCSVTHLLFTQLLVHLLDMAIKISAPAIVPSMNSGIIRSFSPFLTRDRSRLRFKGTFPIRITCGHSCLEVRDVYYQPQGMQTNLLNGVSFSLPEKSFGLIFGQSGSGKTTLLQLLSGLSKPTSGSICTQRYTNEGKPDQHPEPLPPERTGIVFQFPESYIRVAKAKEQLQMKERFALNLQRAFNWVGLGGISLDKDPNSLSGGYKRRLALAIQLVQVPDILILDEPLAGLDWKARADVVKLLKVLKKELTIPVVSHDLREIAGFVDQSWRMEMVES